jgi:hypothetical protein
MKHVKTKLKYKVMYLVSGAVRKHFDKGDLNLQFSFI